ncbi:MAG: ATP-binding cassette domain-containing protein [Alistipes sp.]|uniref:ATP-binding cassette domain-containing protein n=1 Tax=Alistipes sp. TaxID=1872444 RepID=UPI003211D113|nr:ATP-binding cassette domain-containing protein [Alistipes sp.]
MTQNVDRETVVSRLLAADDILILCHKNPDGDTIGSGTALCLAGPSQLIGLFTSNRETIALGEEEEKIDRRRAEESLRAARLEDFVQSLSAGIDTPIGEAGNKLSGGQRQRIGIARALYKQANILFFDEATSALDSGTEEGINRSIAELSQHNRDLTIVVIAHRESSLEYCDRIITLDNNG